MISLTLPNPPTNNHLFATFKGRRILSREGRAYHTSVRLCCIGAGAKMLHGPVKVEVDLYRPRKIGDVERTKALLDGLTGAAYADDSQIIDLHVRRFDDKANPRAEVRLQEWTP